MYRSIHSCSSFNRSQTTKTPPKKKRRRESEINQISSYKFTETRAIIVPANNFPMAKNKASVGRIKTKARGKRGWRRWFRFALLFSVEQVEQAEQFSRDGRASNPSFESARTADSRNGVIARIRFVESREENRGTRGGALCARPVSNLRPNHWLPVAKLG